MGARALGDAGLLVTDGDRDAYLQQKRQLLRSARDVVSVGLMVAEEAAQEAAEVVARAAGVPLGPGSPLEAAALVVQEDLVVLVRSEDAWRFGAGVVCFPSHWMPAEKLGLRVAEVHGPVPHYEAELAVRVDRLLDRLAPPRPVWRRNWMLHASAELHVPEPSQVERTVAPEALWLRSERQVLLALPRSGGILFTIRTQQLPLVRVAGHRAAAARLAETLRASSPELDDYRSNGLDLARVASWLDTEASTGDHGGST